MRVENLEEVDALIEPMREAGRIPGMGIAIVADGATVFAKGYGHRDMELKLPMTKETCYPIASTTKAINATLLGILVDEGKLAWDAPVQSYVPSFRLGDPATSAMTTLRDLVIMRTGLPRHDGLWIGNTADRADLIRRLRYLELSAGFRERFQYCNLTATAAGHVAEVVTGKSWEVLVRQELLEPLGMTNTCCTRPGTGNATQSYYESANRELLPNKNLPCEITAPSGGAVHSTVTDMARWMQFNLNNGMVAEDALITPQTLAEIQSPQIAVGKADISPPTAGAPYAMGWFVDTYNGCARLSHGGYHHDVNSEVMLFPEQRIGIVAFTNFGPSRLARPMAQHAFDLVMGFEPEQPFEKSLVEYADKLESARQRNASIARVAGTAASHRLSDYEGAYQHAGYGQIEIDRRDETLILRRHGVELPLEHWHYDTWAFAQDELLDVHIPGFTDHLIRIVFEMNADGAIASLTIPLESAVSPMRFSKTSCALA